MLFIIGLGLEIGDIPSRATLALSKADHIYFERYTLPVPDEYILYLERETGHKIKELKRSDLEDNIKSTLTIAKKENLAILVPGDPLVATTHHLIMETAKKLGIEVMTYHSSSIFTAAIGESGLDIYKFGPTTTIPFWTEKYKPTSFLDVIKRNVENKEHTLVLLDVDHKRQRTMSASEGIKTLNEAEEKKKTGLLTRKIIVLCNVGNHDQSILYAKFGPTIPKRMKTKTEGKKTALIVPAEMSFAEENYVKSFTSP